MAAKSCKKGDTYIPKFKGCHDLDFKIKNPEATKNKHASQIKKVKQSDLKFDDVFGRYGEDMIISDVANSTQYQYTVKKSLQKDKPSSFDVRQLKHIINWKTRQKIEKALKDESLPKSWDTAFYMANYNKINNMMKKATKELIRDYL